MDREPDWVIVWTLPLGSPAGEQAWQMFFDEEEAHGTLAEWRKLYPKNAYALYRRVRPSFFNTEPRSAMDDGDFVFSEMVSADGHRRLRVGERCMVQQVGSPGSSMPEPSPGRLHLTILTPARAKALATALLNWSERGKLSSA